MIAKAVICDSDFDHDFIVENDQGVAQNITTWTFEALIKRDCNSLTLTSGDGLTILNGAEGILRLSLTSTQTKNFGPGQARILVWRTDDGRKAIGEGTMVFESKDYDA